MKAYSTLLQARQRVLDSVAGSTAAQDYPELVPYLQQALEASAARGVRSRANMLSYSARVRGVVAQLLAPYPTDTPGVPEILRRRIELAGPKMYGLYGLARVPDIDLIREELARIAVQRTAHGSTTST